MGGTRLLSRLSLEGQIARAVSFTVSGWAGSEAVYRKVATTLAQARQIAARMNAANATNPGVSNETPGRAIIRAITPDGKSIIVPETLP